MPASSERSQRVGKHGEDLMEVSDPDTEPLNPLKPQGCSRKSKWSGVPSLMQEMVEDG